MGKNKIKINKETKINEQIPKITLTKQQKIRNLVDKMNNHFYESLQNGKFKIKDTQNTVKNLIKRSNKFLMTEILQGQISVNQSPLCFKFSKRKSKKNTIDQSDQDKFQESLTTNKLLQKKAKNKKLKQQHQKNHRQKQLERSREKILEQKAQQFIAKLQKQKVEFKQNIKKKESKSILNVRAYSEDTIRVMKQKLEDKIIQKRNELAEKIQNIQKRKKERVEKEVNNQISYWQKVKMYESQKKLSIQNQQQPPLFPEIYVPKSLTQRSRMQVKKNLKYLNKSQSQIQHSIFNKKLQNIENYVLKAKLKLQNFQIKQKSQSSGSHKKSQVQSELFQELLISNSIHKTINPQILSSNFSKIKNIDNQKGMMNLQVKIHSKGKNDLQKQKESRKQKKIMQQNNKGKFLLRNLQQGDLDIKANEMKPNKNLTLQYLESSWNQTLNKIKFHQIQKIKGLNKLTIIEKRLDKIDPQGIVNRLKLKARTIEEMDEDYKLFENKIDNNKKNDLFQMGLENRSNQISNSLDSESLTQSKNEFIMNGQALAYDKQQNLKK